MWIGTNLADVARFHNLRSTRELPVCAQWKVHASGALLLLPVAVCQDLDSVAADDTCLCQPMFLFDVYEVPDKTNCEWILMKHTGWHRYIAFSYWCSIGRSACIFIEFAMCM